ncbi:MAG: TRAP transporter substrate-binding protein DctP [Myxococcales bacterium]|nr:TRAP transporter substrate-binding protein DctP [Myxococcales bacterium]
MKRLRLAAALVALACLLAPPPARPATAQAPLVLKVATSDAIDSPTHALMQAFARHAAEVSGNQIEVKLFTGGALGAERDVLKRVRAGSIQAAVVSLEALAAEVPAASVLLAPHLFRNLKESDRRLDGSIRKALQSLLAKHDMVFGAWGPSELRGWASAGSSPLDAKSAAQLVHAAPRSVAETKIAEALGMELSQTPLRTLESLAGNTAYAASLTPLELIAAGLERDATHYAVTNHSLQAAVLVYSKRWYEGLPEDPKRGLAKLPASITRDARKAQRALRPRMLEALEARGVEVVEPSSRERRALTRALRSVPAAVAAEGGGMSKRMLRAARGG